MERTFAGGAKTAAEMWEKEFQDYGWESPSEFYDEGNGHATQVFTTSLITTFHEKLAQEIKIGYLF